MNIALTLIALAAAVAATLFADRNQAEISGTEARKAFSPVRLVTLLLIPVLAAAGSLLLKTKFDEVLHVAMGIGVGVLVVVVAEAFDRGSDAIAPLGLAVAASAVLHTFSKGALENAQLGLAIGLGAGAWMMSPSGVSRGASRAALLGIVAIGGDVLGARAESFDAAALAGTSFALVVVIAGLVAKVVAAKPSQQLLRGGLAVALLAGGAVAVGKGLGHVGDAWMIFLIAMLTGLIVHLLVGPDDRPDSFRFLLATLVWLGAATAAFGEGKGYGMATALVGAAAVPLLLGNTRALLTLGPLASLVLYRIFREFYTDATKSIDIGQHYALVGLGVGVVLPLLPVEWRSEGRGEGNRGAVASLLWTLVVFSAPLISAVILGPKGIIGLIFGLGFASVVEGLRGSQRLETLGLGLAAATVTIVSYDWLDPLLQLQRADKARTLVEIAVALAVVGIAIFGLSLRRANAESI